MILSICVFELEESCKQWPKFKLHLEYTSKKLGEENGEVTSFVQNHFFYELHALCWKKDQSLLKVILSDFPTAF